MAWRCVFLRNGAALTYATPALSTTDLKEERCFLNHQSRPAQLSTLYTWFFCKMSSQSAFTFSCPLAAAKTLSFAGEDLMNFPSAPFPYPIASSPLEHFDTDKQYSNFQPKEDNDLALFLMGDGAVTSKVIDDDTALDGIFSLGDWIVLDNEPTPSPTPTATSFFVPITSTSEAVVKVASPEKAALASGIVLHPIQPLPSKEGAHPIPSLSATAAGMVKENLDFYVDHVESSTGLPCFVNDKFSRVKNVSKVTVPRMTRLHSLPVSCSLCYLSL